MKICAEEDPAVGNGWVMLWSPVGNWAETMTGGRNCRLGCGVGTSQCTPRVRPGDPLSAGGRWCRLEGGLDSLEGPGFDRQPAPPHNHRLVRIQGLREPLAPK